MKLFIKIETGGLTNVPPPYNTIDGGFVLLARPKCRGEKSRRSRFGKASDVLLVILFEQVDITPHTLSRL